MNLAQLKREARAEYRSGPISICPCPDHVRDVNVFLENLIDKVVDAVEESTKPDWEASQFAQNEIAEKFCNFRGV